MLKGKQKKLDVNKDGKISGDDFAMLRGKKMVQAEKGKMINGTGKYIDIPKNIPSLLGASEKELKLFKEYSKSIGKFSKKKMGGGMMQKPIMAESGKMITDSEKKRPLPMLRDSAIERRSQNITNKAKSMQKKMGGGMMMQEPMGYKKGGGVRGGRAEMKGLRPAKMF